tara:strand:- start:6981 stop:7184 length:204 start_codon:yes stop_codon:yes gene_type:complete
VTKHLNNNLQAKESKMGNTVTLGSFGTTMVAYTSQYEPVFVVAAAIVTITAGLYTIISKVISKRNNK